MKVKKDKKGFYNINGAKIKTFCDDGVCIVEFKNYIYFIDDQKGDQQVRVYNNCDCDRCIEDPIKSM